VLLILLLALTLIFAAVLWIGSVIVQGWLYNDLAKYLPVRALVGGAILALFHVGWCAIYKADPGRFDTLTNFKTEAFDGKYDEILSVRKVGNEEKKPVRYVRQGDSNNFQSPDTGKAWGRSDADGMVVAILLTEKGKDKPTRYNANLRPDGTFPQLDETRWEEEKGRRYMDQNAIGKVYRVRSMAYVGNLTANLLHLIVWVLVLWPVMRFALGHAIGMGLALWAITMLAVQPALFGMVTK
jgi:hypothetical protein